MYQTTVRVPYFDGELTVNYYFDDDGIQFEEVFAGDVLLDTDKIFVTETYLGKRRLQNLSTIITYDLKERGWSLDND